MEFAAVARQSAYEAIVAQIESAIDSGELRPGDRLPSERQLMEQFRVSRPTVREAMRVLQATGVLAVHAGDPRGPEVLAYSPQVFRKAFTRLTVAGSHSRIELLQFRIMLESTGSQLAAYNRTDDDIDRMERALHAIGIAAADNSASIGVATDAFQATIRRAAHNELIEITGSVLTGVMRDLIDSSLTDAADRAERVQGAQRYASALMAAIVDHDGPLAARLVRQGIHAYYHDVLAVDEQEQLAVMIGETLDPRSAG